VYVDLSAANLNDHTMLQDMVDGIRPVRLRTTEALPAELWREVGGLRCSRRIFSGTH
jgi:hypothetical protein